MINLGTYLKEKRETARLSIEDVANKTKISIYNLQSLENFDEKNLPASVFVKGYIRLYCKAVGIDASEAIKIYENYLIKKEEQLKNKIKARKQAKRVHKSKFSLKSINLKAIKNFNFKSKWFIAFIVIVVLAVGLIFLLKDRKERKVNNVVVKFKVKDKLNKVEEKEKEIKKETIQEKKVKEEAKKEEKAPKELPKKLLKDKNKEEKIKKEEAKKEEKVEVKDKIKEGKKEEEKEEKEKEEEGLQALNDEKTLSIKAVRKVWIKTKLDDKESFHFTLENGDEKVLTANDKIRLYIGDPSAVELRYNNGEVIQGFGRRGVPRTIVFPGRTKWHNALSM